MPYAAELKRRLEAQGMRVELDDRAESLNKKVRDAQVGQIPLILTVGAKERAAGTLSVRTLDGKVRYGLPSETFLDAVRRHVAQRRLDWDLFEG